MYYFAGQHWPEAHEWPRKEKEQWFEDLTTSKPGPTKENLIMVLMDPILRFKAFQQLMYREDLEDKDFRVIIQPMPPGDRTAEIAWNEYKRRKKGKLSQHELKDFVTKQFEEYFKYYVAWLEGTDDEYVNAVMDEHDLLMWDAFEMFMEINPDPSKDLEMYHYKKTLFNFIATPLLQERAWQRLLGLGPKKEDLETLMAESHFCYWTKYKHSIGDAFPISHPEDLWGEYLKLDPTEDDFMKVFADSHKYRSLAWKKMKPAISNSALREITGNGYYEKYPALAWKILKPKLTVSDMVYLLNSEASEEIKSEVWEMFKKEKPNKDSIRELIHKDQDLKIEAGELLLKKHPTNDDLVLILDICYGKPLKEAVRRLLSRTKNKDLLYKIARHYSSDLKDLKVKAVRKIEELYPVEHDPIYYLKNEPSTRRKMWPKFLAGLESNEPLIELIKSEPALANRAWKELLKRNPTHNELAQIAEHGVNDEFKKKGKAKLSKTTYSLMKVFSDKYELHVR
jgi:hypothetical protein